MIALVLPDIENPFFTSLARGVEDVAQEAGLSVVLCNTDEDPAKEERYLAIADSENMAGVLLAPATASPNLRPLLVKRAMIKGFIVWDHRDRTADFLRDYMAEFHDYVARVLTVLPRQEAAS